MQENHQLKRRLVEPAEPNQKVPEYENRIALLSQEIERLKGSIDQKNTYSRQISD